MKTIHEINQEILYSRYQIEIDADGDICLLEFCKDGIYDYTVFPTIEEAYIKVKALYAEDKERKAEQLRAEIAALQSQLTNIDTYRFSSED